MDTNLEENRVIFTAGDGTAENPFIILDRGGLEAVSDNLSAHYKLGADIDLLGEEFTPMGTSSSPFTGNFDGDGYAVRGLKVAADGYAGLFGSASGAAFQNLRIEGAEIESTGSSAGILAGSAEKGRIESCVVTGSVRGAEYTGGLAGKISGTQVSESGMKGSVEGGAQTGLLTGYAYGGRVSRCRAEGSVKGAEYVGGLIGRLCEGTVLEDSYAAGKVEMEAGSTYAGGLVGKSESSYTPKTSIERCYASACMEGKGKGLVGGADSNTIINNCYYDVQMSGITGGRGTGKLTSAFTCKDFFSAWDFEGIWEIVEGESYPYLKWEGEKGIRKADKGEIYGGAGTEENPYQIRTPGGFLCIPYEQTGSYRMTDDIDLLGEEFTPVGTSESPFKGSFDGGGHAVRGLKVAADGCAGLFGSAVNATFKNLRIEGAEIESTGSSVGILAGSAERGIIESCVVTGSVRGMDYTGGFVGRLTGSNAKIQESYVEGNITGSSYVGGLVGQLSGSIIDSYVKGSVTSSSNSNYTGGLAGYSSSSTIKNSYASAQISSNGQGLAYVYSSTTIQNSFFDSDIAGKTSPTSQARTTQQMFSKDTYTGWDMESIWEHEEGAYPLLRKIEFLKNQLFELQVHNRTWHSVIVRWAAISGVAEYELHFNGEVRKISEPEVFIEDLLPDTDYELKIIAKLDDSIQVTSKILNLRTRKISAVKGLHSMHKEGNSITLTWDQIAEAQGYEVTYGENVILTDTNTCTLTELNNNVPYVISVRALLEDGGELISSPIVEKIYELESQTDYAGKFLAKCEGQTWFIDEVENLLNQKGKSICTVSSKDDFAAIYALNLSGRGISGQIPLAIGELYQLRYLYLANNNLSGQLPKEIDTLAYLIGQDLSGNQFTE